MDGNSTRRSTLMLILVLQQHILSVCYLLLRDMRARAAEEAEREAAAVARRRRKKRRAFWVRPWLLRRPEYGQFEKLMKELQMEDLPAFRNFVRVPPALFLELLEHVGPRIQKEDTKFRKALPAGLKLAVTLRYLATGNSYRSLQYGFRVAFNTISKFIPEVCQAIIVLPSVLWQDILLYIYRFKAAILCICLQFHIIIILPKSHETSELKLKKKKI